MTLVKWPELPSPFWEVLASPQRSPSLNARAERFVRSIKEPCHEKAIFFGEGSLRKAIHEFVEHYHGERNHQGTGNHTIQLNPEHLIAKGKIRKSARLGGMLNYYYRDAA